MMVMFYSEVLLLWSRISKSILTYKHLINSECVFSF